MRIVVDAAGGDFGPAPNVEGALRARRELGAELLLTGPSAVLTAELAKHGAAPGEGLEVVDAPETVGMGEDPVRACREKPDNSIMTAARLVAEGRADALFSAGHSGATMVACLWHLKRLNGVLRPAIAVPFPTTKGVTVLLDGGANTECRPWHLLQFAAMGALYAKHGFGVQDPGVGILSNGEEESKGNDLVREAVPLLKYGGLRFVGPVEGRDLPFGKADVVVCDGYTGNVAVKTAEGTAKAIFEQLRSEIEGRPLRMLGAWLLKGAFQGLKAKMSPDTYGGAPLLGVGGVALVGHGRSNAAAVFNAVRQAQVLAASGVEAHIAQALERLKEGTDVSRVLGTAEGRDH